MSNEEYAQTFSRALIYAAKDIEFYLSRGNLDSKEFAKTVKQIKNLAEALDRLNKADGELIVE